VGVDSGEHATPSSVDQLAEGRCSSAAHASAGCRSPKLLSGVNRPTPAGVTGGHSLRKPLTIATGSKTSSLAGDAREHPTIGDRALLRTAGARGVWPRDLATSSRSGRRWRSRGWADRLGTGRGERPRGGRRAADGGDGRCTTTLAEHGTAPGRAVRSSRGRRPRAGADRARPRHGRPTLRDPLILDSASERSVELLA
jgi:hypothetical protein